MLSPNVLGPNVLGPNDANRELIRRKATCLSQSLPDKLFDLFSQAYSIASLFHRREKLISRIPHRYCV